MMLATQWFRATTIAAPFAAMTIFLSGCGGGSGNPLNAASDTLAGSNLIGGGNVSAGVGSRAVVYGGTPAGAVYDALKQQYRITAGGANTDPAAYDVLIVNGPSFPGRALRSDAVVQKAIQKGREIVFLEVTGEQKEAALKGHVVTYTTSASRSY